MNLETMNLETMNLETKNLETKRCYCRLPLEADTDLLQALYADTRTGQFSPNINHNGPEAIRTMLYQWRLHWDHHGFGPWLIEVKGDRPKPIGVGGVSMRNFDGQSLPNLWYRFFPDAWGSGFATEFTEACLTWMRRETQVDTVFALVHPQNSASLRVLEKLGMQSDGELQLAEQTSLRYRLKLV